MDSVLEDWLLECGFKHEVIGVLKELKIHNFFELSFVMNDNDKLMILRRVTNDTVTLDLMVALRVYLQRTYQMMAYQSMATAAMQTAMLPMQQMAAQWGNMNSSFDEQRKRSRMDSGIFSTGMSSSFSSSNGNNGASEVINSMNMMVNGSSNNNMTTPFSMSSGSSGSQRNSMNSFNSNNSFSTQSNQGFNSTNNGIPSLYMQNPSVLKALRESNMSNNNNEAFNNGMNNASLYSSSNGSSSMNQYTPMTSMSKSNNNTMNAFNKDTTNSSTWVPSSNFNRDSNGRTASIYMTNTSNNNTSKPNTSTNRNNTDAVSKPHPPARKTYVWSLIYTLDIADFDNKYQKAYEMAMQLKNYPNCITEHRHAFNKVFRCREGEGCEHLTKIQYEKDANCIHIFQSGAHSNHRIKSTKPVTSATAVTAAAPPVSAYMVSAPAVATSDFPPVVTTTNSNDDGDDGKEMRGLTLKVRKYVDVALTDGMKPRQILDNILLMNEGAKSEQELFEIPTLRQIQNYCDRLQKKGDGSISDSPSLSGSSDDSDESHDKDNKAIESFTNKFHDYKYTGNDES